MMAQGQHLLFEGVSRQLLIKELIETFLLGCARLLGMTVIAGPQCVKQDSGWAGIVVIAESHISVHTRGLEVYGDVFSCQPFDANAVRLLAETELLIETRPKMHVTSLTRGWQRSS